jgi:hypothetical protein
MKHIYLFALLLILVFKNLIAQDKDPNTKKEFLKGKLDQG